MPPELASALTYFVFYIVGQVDHRPFWGSDKGPTLWKTTWLRGAVSQESIRDPAQWGALVGRGSARARRWCLQLQPPEGLLPSQRPLRSSASPRQTLNPPAWHSTWPPSPAADIQRGSAQGGANDVADAYLTTTPGLFFRRLRGSVLV